MKKQLNEVKRMQQLAGLISESQLNENTYYIHDEEGLEEPIGPFTLSQAKQELAKQGTGWKLIDAETAKQIWSHLEDESQQLNEDIFNDIDQDLMHGDMDQKEQIKYLKDVINFCQSKINEIGGILKESQLNEILGMSDTELNEPALGILWREATPEDDVSSEYVWIEDNVRNILTRLYKSLGEEDDDAIKEVIDALFYEMSPLDQGITSTVGEVLQGFKEEYEEFGL